MFLTLNFSSGHVSISGFIPLLCQIFDISATFYSSFQSLVVVLREVQDIPYRPRPIRTDRLPSLRPRHRVRCFSRCLCYPTNGLSRRRTRSRRRGLDALSCCIGVYPWTGSCALLRRGLHGLLFLGIGYRSSIFSRLRFRKRKG